MADHPIDLSRLSVAERLALLEQVWESLAQDEATVTETPEMLEELDRRLDALRADPEAGRPWGRVRERLEGGSS